MVGCVLRSVLYCLAFIKVSFAAAAKPAFEDGTALLQVVFSEKPTSEHANVVQDHSDTVPGGSAEASDEGAEADVVGGMAAVKDEKEGGANGKEEATDGKSNVYQTAGGDNYDPAYGPYPGPPYPPTSSTSSDEVGGMANVNLATSPAGKQEPADYDVSYGDGGSNDYEGDDDDYSEKANDYHDDYDEGVYEESKYTDDKYSKGFDYSYARDNGHDAGGRHDKYGKYHYYEDTATKDSLDKNRRKRQCDHDHPGRCGEHHRIGKYDDYHPGKIQKYASPKAWDYQHADYHRRGPADNRKAHHGKEYGKPLDHMYAEHGDHHHGKSQDVRKSFDSLGGAFRNRAYFKGMGDKYDDYHGAGEYVDASNKYHAYRREHGYKRSGSALLQSGAAKPWHHHVTVEEVHRCTKRIKVYRKELVNKCSEVKRNFTVARWTWGKTKHFPAMKTKTTCMKVPAWKKTDKCIKIVRAMKTCKKLPRVTVSHTCMKHFQVYKKEVEPKCHENSKNWIAAKHVYGKLQPVHVQKSEKVCVHVPVQKKVHKCVKWSKRPRKEMVEQCFEHVFGWKHY
eukprot:TRINITY_DN11496_c0_g1_i1.p1 TRINITY_DN11496_c0_g1~~TRINITY_DN11496_c0_g1_i1.p1  ORF type:complete len:564 (+),score=97.56 TRINITY_DN11496_c0_g1_i1:59-1750(+)